MKKLVKNYESYYSILIKIKQEKQTKNQKLEEELLIPFIHLDAVKYLLINAEKKNKNWLELADAINKQHLKKVFFNETYHAEMKMLSFNEFKTEIFTTKSWPAVITKDPCLYCWMTLWVTAINYEQKKIITEYLGCSGDIYLNWKWHTETKECEMIDKYSKKFSALAKEIVSKIENIIKEKNDDQQIINLVGQVFKLKKKKKEEEEEEEETCQAKNYTDLNDLKLTEKKNSMNIELLKFDEQEAPLKLFSKLFVEST